MNFLKWVNPKPPKQISFMETLQVFRHLQVFLKIGVLKNFAIFTGKYLCWSFLLIKLQAFRLVTIRDFNTGVFLWILQSFYKQHFFIERLVAYSRKFQSILFLMLILFLLMCCRACYYLLLDFNRYLLMLSTIPSS